MGFVFGSFRVLEGTMKASIITGSVKGFCCHGFRALHPRRPRSGKPCTPHKPALTVRTPLALEPTKIRRPNSQGLAFSDKKCVIHS